MTFKLIACDGGGIRGYITSSLIQALNDDTEGKLLSQTHGFAGTSTGGLISVALGAGVSIGDVQDIYANRADEIFTRNGRWHEEGEMIDADQEGLASRKCTYTSDGLTKIMKQYLEDRTFRDISGGKMVAVVTAQLEDTRQSPPRWTPVTFNNREDTFADISLVDACLSTSAAPVYFPPHSVSDLGYFADGGTFANNPVMNGIEVAMRNSLLNSPLDVEVISFGTGLTPVSIPPSAVGNPRKWGTNRWMALFKEKKGVPKVVLLKLALDLSAANMATVTQALLGSNLIRINPVLRQDVELDDHSKKAYERMNVAIAEAKASPQWEEAKTLVAGW